MSAPAGYSGKPLIAKLGLKAGEVLAVFAPPADYAVLAAPLPPAARIVEGPTPDAALVHLFAATRADLAARLPDVVASLPPGAALWVSWPKKTSRRFVDLTEDGVREKVLPTGLVDVKVAAVDADWSALKFSRRRT